MEQPTLEHDIVIEARRTGYVRYRRLSTGARWEVFGTCNQCGLCVVGAAHPEHYQWRGSPGTPFAVVDVRVAAGRLDEPVTPGFTEQMERMGGRCSLVIRG